MFSKCSFYGFTLRFLFFIYTNVINNCIIIVSIIHSSSPKLTPSGPGIFFSGALAGEGGGGGDGKCPRPITPKLFMVLKRNLAG